MLNIVNQKGYLSERTRAYLSSIFRNNDIYIKTVYSSNVNSIMNEGIRCLGSSTSGRSANLSSTYSIQLNDIITKIDGMYELVHT